jgi:DNA-directed RNA polymerase subunit RPC12/RpoP
MVESFVRFLCPACGHQWEARPTEVPAVRSEVACPACGAQRRVAELLRTDRDLRIVQGFQ